MDISHDFQFKIQSKIIATLFELNNHVTISKLKFKLGDNLILNHSHKNRIFQGELSPKKSEVYIRELDKIFSIQIQIGTSNQPYLIQAKFKGYAYPKKSENHHRRLGWI